MKKNFWSFLLACSLFLGLTFTAFSGASSAPQYSWKAYHFVAATSNPYVTFYKDYLQDLSKKSNDAIQVQLFLPGQLPYKSSQIMTALGSNAIQLALDDSYRTAVEESGVIVMPGLMNTFDEADQAFEVMNENLKGKFASKGVVLLAASWYTPNILWSNKPVRSLADMKGQRIRVTSKEVGGVVQDLGGIPIVIPSAEVTVAVQRGLMDAEITGVGGGGLYRWMNYKYVYTLGFNMPSGLFVMNYGTYQGLPKNLQKLVDDLSVEWAHKLNNYALKMEKEFLGELPGKGLTVTQVTPADQATATEAMRKYWPKWAAESKGNADILHKVMTRLKK